MFYTLDSLHVLLEENVLELKICLKIIKPRLLFKEISSQISFDLTYNFKIAGIKTTYICLGRYEDWGRGGIEQKFSAQML